MIKILFLSLFLFSFNSWSEETSDNSLISTVKNAIESFSQIREVGKFSVPCLENLGKAPKVVLTPQFSFKGVGDLCNQFIEKSGELGPRGLTIFKTITSLPKEQLEKTYFSNTIPDMDSICPDFKTFSNELKSKFWVWAFASIAWEESSCNESPTKTKGIHGGLGVGLLQLDDLRSLRKSRGVHCDVPSVRDGDNNVACGVDILNEQLLGKDSIYFKHLSTGELFWRFGYWKHLRLKPAKPKKASKKTSKKASKKKSQSKTVQQDIKDLIKLFPYCNTSSQNLVQEDDDQDQEEQIPDQVSEQE